MLYIYILHIGWSFPPSNIGFHEGVFFFFSGNPPSLEFRRPVTVVCVLWPYIAPVHVEVGALKTSGDLPTNQ